MVPYLQVFGEMFVITKNKTGKISAKLENKGEYGMLCGYTDERSPSTYRILLEALLSVLPGCYLQSRSRALRVSIAYLPGLKSIKSKKKKDSNAN